MVDPFSIATGAVGIVSLGIQVCGGALEYLSAVKHRNEELTAAWDSARTQAANFECLDDFIARIRAERPGDADFLLQRLEDARGPLHKLRDVVAALAGLPPSMIPTLQNAAGSSLLTITNSTNGLKEMARDVGRAMTYKFHRDNVKDLQRALQHVSTSLHTAMLNVILNENEKHGHDVKSLQTTVLSIGLTVESKGADIFSTIASLVSQNQTMLTIAQQNKATLREIQDSQNLLRDEYAQVLPVLAEFKLIAQQLNQQNQCGPGRTEPRQMANRAVQSLPPELTKQALDTYSSCICRGSIARSSMSSLQLRSFSVLSRKQIISRHELSCPLHAVTREQTRAVGARVHLQLGSFLSYLVEANFWCTVGQGGCSFGPSLRWKNIVPKNKSPVQNEFARVGYWLQSSPGGRREWEVVDRLKSMKENVLMLYQKGQASINDVDQRSNNHLQCFVDLLVQSLDHKLLTQEVVDVSISMIRFYIDAGLTCDERDNYFSVDPVMTYSLWLRRTFTTLAKSASLLLPSGGKAAYQSFRLVSSIARVSDPVVEDVDQMMPCADPGLFFTQIVDHEIYLGRLSPVAKAILIRSLKDLESSVRLSPESLLEKTRGLTVLHLSIGWPPGLSLLLRTRAKLLLDTPDDMMETPNGHINLAWPFSYAAANHCAQSLDLVLQAGCNLNPEDSKEGRGGLALSIALEVTSAECAEVFARHMARRRRELFALARSNMNKIKLAIYRLRIGKPRRNELMTAVAAVVYPRHARSKPAQRIQPVASNIIMRALEEAAVPLPVSLPPFGLVDHDVYHLSGLPFVFFPIFERHGFAGYNEPDRYGLRPIMNQGRSLYSLSRATLGEVIQSVLPWLIQHGCLNAKPARVKNQSRMSAAINMGVTGWHYLSMNSEMAIFARTTDPEGAQRQLLANPSVKGKVRLLDKLMAEFTEQLKRRTGSPRDLKDFIFGPWRTRVAGLYDVDAEEVKGMERVLGGKIQTKVLPKRLEAFFGDKFPFFDDEFDDESDDEFNDEFPFFDDRVVTDIELSKQVAVDKERFCDCCGQVVT